MVWELGTGIVLGLLFVTAAGRWARARELLVYAIGLVVAALLYVAFALAAGRPEWLLIEGGGVAFFAALSVLGLRGSPPLIGLGWALHMAWDAALHGYLAPGVAPDGYPTACAGFDLVLAIYVTWVFRGSRASGSAPTRRSA
jgi:hypothetical protein